ncbi:MAG: hypothetical protein KBT06_11600, partial [Prevotellaceae bacterium]|nr:hypothetical protein [Candidatus Colivivens equi]
MLLLVLPISAQKRVKLGTFHKPSVGKEVITHKSAKKVFKGIPKTVFAKSNLDVDVVEVFNYGELDDGTNDLCVCLYNEANDFPCIQFDIYANPSNLSGSYSVTDGTVNTEQGFVMISEEEGDYLDDCSLTISKVNGGYKIQGECTGYSYGDSYSFSAIWSGEFSSLYSYDYEPDEVTTINFTASQFEADDFSEDYGVVELYLWNNDYQLCLEYNTYNYDGKIPAGTYSINDSGNEGTFTKSVGGDEGYDYGCYLATDFDDEGYYYSSYYLVSGNVTISYDTDGAMQISVNAKSAKGSTIKATYKGKPAPTPGEGIELVIADYGKTSFTDLGISVSVNANGGTSPAYNSNSKDLRAYAKNILTIDAGSNTMTQIDFDISAQGLKRQAEISPSTGEMTYDLNNQKVYWQGQASKVEFTVGQSATYGTESNKAGQFDFTKITISTGGTPTPPTEKTLTSISVSGQKTELVQNSAFVFGGKVTANYNNGSTSDVTSKSTFSGYDMSKVGSQTVVVSYSENG